MKPDQDRLKVLLVDTIALLCKSGLTFKKELRVQGLLGITMDDEEVFIVQLDEKLFADGRGPSRPFEGSDRDSKSLSSPSYPVMLTRNRPSLSPSRGSRTRGRPPFAYRSTLAKRQHLDHGEFFSTGCETNTEGSFLHTDLNLNDVNASSPLEIGTASTNEPVGDFGLTNNSMITRSVVSDGFQPEYSSLPFDSSFLQPEFTSTRFTGSAEDFMIPVHEGELKLKIKRKIKNNGSVNVPVAKDLTKIQYERPRYELNNQWHRNEALSSGDPQSEKEDWHGVGSANINGANSIKHETSDGSFKESVNEMWDSANGAPVDDSCNSFSAKYQRRRHRESEGKCFACQYEGCDKAFFRKDHLVRHQRQKHGKPYGVDSQMIFYCHESDCNKMFYKVSTLRRHMVEAHNYASEPEFAQQSMSSLQHQQDFDPEFSQQSELRPEFSQPPASSSQPCIEFDSEFSQPLAKPQPADFPTGFRQSPLQARVELESRASTSLT